MKSMKEFVLSYMVRPLTKRLIIRFEIFRRLRSACFRRERIRKLLTSNESDERPLAFFSSFFNYGDLVFDVGANMGSKSRIFLMLGANVIAFEPQRVCVEILRTRIRDEGNLEVVDKALGREVGEAEIHICEKEGSGLSSLSTDFIALHGKHNWNDSHLVQVTT